MSSYDISTLTEEARVVMDKNMTSTALSGLGDVDTLSVDDIISAAIPRAARLILLSAPLYRIDTTVNGITKAEDGTITSPVVSMTAQGDGYVGRMKLPDDFLRLASIRMSDWKRPGRAISEDDEEYAEQQSEFAGIRGNASKPIAALVQGEDGLYMELYSSNTDTATLKQFTYVAEPTVTNDSKITLPSKLIDAIVYLTASLAMESLGEKEQSDELSKTAEALAEING